MEHSRSSEAHETDCVNAALLRGHADSSSLMAGLRITRVSLSNLGSLVMNAIAGTVPEAAGSAAMFIS